MQCTVNKHEIPFNKSCYRRGAPVVKASLQIVELYCCKIEAIYELYVWQKTIRAKNI